MEDILVPDLAGWRRSRMPHPPDAAYITLTPDWVCEVLSPATRTFDLQGKRPVYTREGVAHLWLVEPLERTLEAFELRETQWVPIATAKDDRYYAARAIADMGEDVAVWRARYADRDVTAEESTRATIARLAAATRVPRGSRLGSDRIAPTARSACVTARRSISRTARPPLDSARLRVAGSDE